MAQIKRMNCAISSSKRSSSTWGSANFVESNGVTWVTCAVAITCAFSFVYLLAMARAGQCNSLSTVVASQAKHPLSHSVASPAGGRGADVSCDTNTTTGSQGTHLSRIVFGIAGAAEHWATRGEYVKRWYGLEKGRTRAIVWLDEEVNATSWPATDEAPPFRVSEAVSMLRAVSSNSRKRAATRIARVVTETFRLGLPDVDWFVMGDDDTLFFPTNLVHVLGRYDHRRMYYVGGSSETHSQNILFSYRMAFGGGGFAISYPLATELARTQDACLARYPDLFGSDERVFACISELGVAMTKNTGFHQLDIQGSPLGILAAHPQTPLLSLHHLDLVQPLFPTLTKLAAVDHLLHAASLEPASLLQQSICYANSTLPASPISSISVSWGYVVQVYTTFLTPRELETPMRTFSSLKRRNGRAEFPFNTRETPRDLCQRPAMFFMESVSLASYNNSLLESVYLRSDDDLKKKMRASCPNQRDVVTVRRVRVLKEPVTNAWFQAPRRSCCRVTAWSRDAIELRLRDCQAGETLTSNVP